MKIAAIIAEYNPFHKGHQWQIDRLREQGFEYIIAIMSGCFVQRGSPAIFNKYQRANLALLGCVDLVVELPLPYACATAQRFAFGAVRIAEAIGCIDALCFGSECGDLGKLNAVVDALLSPQFSEKLAPFLAQGMTFAKARTLAVKELTSEEIASILEEPNNSLGIEYMLQLRELNSTIKPLTIPRKSVSHHEEGSVEGFSSATNIRSLLFKNELKTALEFVPDECKNFMSNLQPINFDEKIVLARLRTLSKEQLSKLPDCSEGIENRLFEAIRSSCSLEEIWQKTKTKRYSLARIRRLTIAAFLDLEADMNRENPPYIRLLGFNKNGQKILSIMRKQTKIPHSFSLANLSKFSETSKKFAEIEAKSVDLYNLFESNLEPCGEDFRFNPSIMK